MSIDSGMDFEEKLFPLVGEDAPHEYSRWALLVKFITNGDERLGASSDSSRSVMNSTNGIHWGYS